MKKCLRNLIKIYFIAVLTFPQWLWAQSTDPIAIKKDDPTLRSGSIYYSTNKKNELVIRTNIWGAVQYPGVHYIPIGTKFLEAVSIAGGPLDHADTANITLSTLDPKSKDVLIKQLSIQDALAKAEANPILQPDDIIVIKQDRVAEKTQLWLGVGTFLLSLAAFGLLVEDHNKK